MATQTTGGGSLTSFTNTPQANGDYYTLREDEILAAPSLYNYNTTSKTFTFDVMSNDLGGNAKSLFSVEDDWGNAISSDTTLLDKDTLDTAGASQWELTAQGNWIRIVNGKIEYRIADTTHPNDPNAARDVNSLGVSDSILNDTFVYAIRLGNGTLSKATVTVNILGANDGPSANADTSTTGENTALTVNVLVNDSDADTADTLTVTSASAPPGKGIASVVGNQVRFDPGADFDHLAQGASEQVVVTYVISDGHGPGSTSTSTVTITVTGTNDGPVANADTGSGGENQVLTIDVVANDTDPDDGAVLTVTAASAPSGKGTAMVVGNQVQFNPGTDFDHLAQGVTEQVVVNYTIQDEHGSTSSSTVTITVTGTNDAPVANADTAAGTENQTLLVDVLANDTDADDGHVLTLTGANAPAGKGAASVVGNQLQFDPGTDFDHLAHGVTENVVVTYTMQDEHGATSTSSVTITVTGTNDTPVAQAASNSLLEDASVCGNVGATDADDGAVLSYALTGAAPAGLTFHTDGSYTFDASSYDGLAEGEPLVLTIPFTATDEHSATSAPANLTITITGTNDAPVVNNVAVTTPVEDGPAVPGSFSGDDVDSDDSAATLTYEITSAPSEGTVVNNLDGTFSFDPGDDFQDLAEGETRQVSFTYTATDSHDEVSNTGTVTLTVTGTNDDPVIAVLDGDSAGGAFDETNAGLASSGTLTVTDVDTTDTVQTTATIAVLGNQGTLSDDDLLAMFSITDGTDLDLTANTGDSNNLHWSFDSGSEAFDFLAEGQVLTLTYTLTSEDEHDGSDTQDVTITITGTNDTPQLTASVTAHTYTDTADDDYFGTVAGTLTTADPDTGDHATYSVSDGADDSSRLGFDTSSSNAYGTLYLNSSTGAYEFVPDDTAIEALKGDDQVSFTLTVTDDAGASDSETLTIDIHGTNDTPELSATLTEATFSDTSGNDVFTAASGDLSSTDRDSPETATYGVLNGVPDDSLDGYDTSKSTAYGKLYVDSATGNYTFVPDDAGIEGLKSGTTLFFTLQVTDGSGETVGQTLTLNLTGANDMPEAPATNSATTDEDTASAVTLIGATDRDLGETLTYSVKAGTEPEKGSVSFDDANGTFTYTPNTDANGSDSFTIVVTDADGATAEQVVSVTINPVNDDPVAGDDIASTDEDTPLNLSAATLLANDTDVDIATNGQVLSISDVTDGTHGSAVVNPDGSVTYTPDPNFNGTDTITYTVSDGNGGTDTATVTITINAVNDAPEAGTDAYTTAEDTPLVVVAASGVLGNDSDVENDSLSVVAGTVATANGGSITFAADGSFTYTPAADFNGTDSVTYTLSDGNGGFDTGTVLLTVTPVNDAAEITGDTTGSVTESGGVGESDAGIPVATGDLDSTDVDNAPDSWTVVSTPASSYYGYGSFTIDASGHWTYTVDNSDPIVNGLNGTSITDQFTVTTVDGTEQVVEVTINGANDAAYITGEATGNVTEAGEASAGFPTASGDLRSDDVDNADDEFQVVDTPAASDKGYGTYTVGNLGTWTYTLDNSNADVQALNVGDTATDTFTVYSEDGTPQVVTITIAGANDAAVLGGDDQGEVIEATASNTGTPSASGTLTADDVDNVDNHFQANSGTGENGYGTFSVDEDGNWTYTLDNTNPDVDALQAGQTLGDTFEVLSDDGTSHFVTIKIDGATDNVAPTLTPDTLYVSNSTTATFSTDVLLGNDTDPDGLALTVTGVSGPGVVLNTNGTFTVTTGSATTPFTFTYDATDGAGNTRTQTVTVNVVGTNSDPNGKDTVDLTGQSYNASYIDGKAGQDALTDGSGTSTLTGGDGNDTLIGSAGSDLLIGGANNDDLQGGDGNDILRGGMNNDSLAGGNGVDLIDFSDAAAGVGLTGGNAFTLAASGSGSFNSGGVGLGNDNYTSIEGVIGTQFNDTITGNNSDNVIRGGAGTTDTLNGSGGVDLLDYSDATGGLSGTSAFTLGNLGTGSFNGIAIGVGTDNYTNMEGVIGSAFDDNITGNAGDNVLRGGSGNDTLSGLGGNDILTGGTGADTLTGGTGNDTFVFAPPLNNVDTITDYSNVVGNSDTIDVTGIVNVPTGGDLNGYIRVTTTGLVQVDATGGGDSWMTIANVNTAGVATYKFQYLQNGTSTSVSIAPVAPPIGIDLDGDGQVGFLATDSGVTFDYGAGKVSTAWVAPEDGILVRDGNHDGAVTHDEMVFATTGSDLDGLAAYDSNHDGQLSGADSDFADFAVWQDSNSNGTVDSGEMVNLTALGIASISLTSDGVGYSAAGGDVQVVGTGSFTRADGTTGVLADSVFATGSLSNEEQMRTALSAGSNVALVGAVAAAGLMAVPVQAEFRAESHSTLDPVAPAQAAALQSISPVQDTQENHALSGETQVPVDAPSAAATHAAAPTDSSIEAHGIDTAPAPTAEALTSLLQGTELPDAASASQQLAVADAIVPVSAEMLQSAMAGIAAHGADPATLVANPAGDLSQVLADAIAGASSHAPDIDALLSALPDADSGHPVASLAAIAGGDFTAESVGFASLTQHIAFAGEIMLIHQDAPPAAV